MKISIIIPAYNEAANIERLVNYLLNQTKDKSVEIIVVDGGSNDETIERAKKAGALVYSSPENGRAAQMNYGANFAKSNILYFVHADSYPPPGFVSDIIKAVSDGFKIGRYQTKFDSPSRLLKLNAFFTRFDIFMCYGGDQTLFITKDLFTKLTGFDSRMQVMEEYDLVQRARPLSRYKIFSAKALVSARKYERNSWWKVQKANYAMIRLFKKGTPQIQMLTTYKKMLN